MTAKVGRARGAGQQANRPVVEGVVHTRGADATITDE